MGNDYNKIEEKLNKGRAFQSLGHHIAPRLEPVLRKKAGFDARLLEYWPQIVGEGVATMSTPFKIRRVRGRADGEMPTATLFIACQGFAAVKIQHQGDEIIGKVNQFFGVHTIDKVKIVQRNLPFAGEPPVSRRPLTSRETAWLEEQNAPIVDAALRASMMRLGKNIIEYSKRNGYDG